MVKARTICCVIPAMLLAVIAGWAQHGSYTSEFRVSPPAPAAPNPFSQSAAKSTLPPFGKATPQRFDASPFPDSSRNLGFVRNRFAHRQRRPHKSPQPVVVYVPLVYSPAVYPYDPNSYGLEGTGPASNQLSENSAEDAATGIQPSSPAAESEASDTSDITFLSTPIGSDIFVDGNFVGNTPSTLPVASGFHTIYVQQWGYEAWHRNLTVTAGGKITIDASLQPH